MHEKNQYVWEKKQQKVVVAHKYCAYKVSTNERYLLSYMTMHERRYQPFWKVAKEKYAKISKVELLVRP